jgi:hypothetical protein
MKYEFVTFGPLADSNATARNIGSGSERLTEEDRIKAAEETVPHFGNGRYALVKREGDVLIIVGEWSVQLPRKPEVTKL